MANQILTENQKPGTPKSVWDAPSSNQIEGFATQISVDNGSTVSFKINLNVAQGSTAPYHIEIYRLGYYGGNGATLVTTLNGLTGRAQPNPLTDSRGLVDAGNWSLSASWATPATAVSGVYLAKLVRDDNGATNQIPFIVRDDASTSDIVLQTSDTTWQAYNGWGGRNGQLGPSLYGNFTQPTNLSSDPSPLDYNRAFAVSYDRPILTRDGVGTYAGPQDSLYGADYAAIYWLEKNGYDVSYISGVDSDRLGASAIEQHKAFVSVGHDEYWSATQRANVEAARDAGVNLLFWSGNEVFWKARWENSIADGADHRTLVTYKETRFNNSPTAGPQDYPNVDPNNQWTGTWRDLRFVNSVASDGVTHTAVGAKPENALTGQLFVADGTGQMGGALNVPAALAGLRMWRDTGIGPNGATGIAPGILGYEWDASPNDAFRPAGLIKLSDTTLSWDEILTDQGNHESAGTATHNLSLYRAPSGALVFGAGTVFWSWGLSNQHDNSPYTANIENKAIQQFTVNLFADMGIQPGVADAVLQSAGLVRASASSDHIAATATMNNLPDTVVSQTQVTISGTATDVDNDPSNPDGKVAVVEVSLDGGQTWKLAQGTSNWTYSWTTGAPGTYTIEARAIDDSLNLPSTFASDVVTVGSGGGGVSLFGSATPNASLVHDGQAVELGMKFQATTAGSISGLRYYRASGDAADTDTRAGHLWSSTGTLLGTATFSSPPGQSGWQVANLSTPVQLQPGVTYVVSYNTANNYEASGAFFGSAVTDPTGALTAPSSAASGGNGVYLYGSGGFPTQTFNATNYWVDVVFSPSGGTTSSQIGFTTTTLSLAEGNTGTTAFAYTVTRTGDTSGASSASWAVTGSGTSPANAADFQGGVLPSGTVSFAAGETSKTVTVNVAGDTTVEPDEGFTVTLSGAAGATLGTATAAGTITNDDAAAGGGVTLFGSTTPTAPLSNDGQAVELGMKFQASTAGSITALRYFRGSGDAADTDTRAGHLWSSTGTLLGSVTFTSGPGQSGWQVANLSTPVQLQPGVTYIVSYNTANNYEGTGAFFGSAFTDPTGTLTAPSSAASGGNGVYLYGSGGFPTQTFNASNYWVDVVFSPSGGTTSPQIGFTTTTLSLAEGNTGTTAFAYTVTRTGDTSGASSANWTVTGSGTNAANAADFQGGVLPSGTVSFAAGETSKTITVNVAGDTTVEPDETFTVTLSGAAGATLGTATAAGTIANDDAAAGAQIGFTTTTLSLAEGNTGTTAFAYTVSRTGDTTGASSASWAVTGSGTSPANAADFQGGVLPSGTVSFAAGETSKTVTVNVAGDTAVEPNETFTVTLSGAAGATLGTVTAAGTITNDDAASGGGVTLFGSTAPTAPLSNDRQAVELGMKFQAASAGSVTALRYFRASGDAADTDTRAGHLWSSTGALLGTATFTSSPGQSGWQAANLSTPVQLQAGATYIVSYKTANNYEATSNFFGSAFTDPTGTLTAPASAASGGNGVFFYGSATTFPNQSFNASNYWVDVVFSPSGAAAASPQTAAAATAIQPTGQVLTASASGSVLTGGPADDTLTAGAGPDTLTGGGGADLFVFPTQPLTPAHLTDFTAGVDHLDVSALLKSSGYAGTDPIADGYMRVESDGQGGSMLRFDADSSGPKPPVSIIDLQRLAIAHVSPSDWVLL